MLKPGEHVSEYCRTCKKTTMQEVVATFDHDFTTETDGWVLECDVNTALLRCGCNTAQIRVEQVEPTLEQVWIELIPPAPRRPLPNWTEKLPKHVGDVLKEVHGAHTRRQNWLVAMGARTLVDMFALERVGDVGGFAAKLERLQKEGDLSPKDKLLIEAAVEVGHGATHRAQPPSDADCSKLLDIVENLLHRLVLAGHGAELAARHPRRPKGSKKP